MHILKIQPKNAKKFPLLGLKCGISWCYSLGRVGLEGLRKGISGAKNGFLL